MKLSKTKKVVAVTLAAGMLLSAQGMFSGAIAATNPATKVANNVTVTSKKPTTPALTIIKEKLVVNDQVVELEGVVQSNALLVNAKQFATIMGASISYSKATKMTTIKRSGTTLVLKADDKYVQQNGAKKFITHAPRVVQGKTFVEVAQLTQMLGGDVLTDDESGLKIFYSVKLLSGAINPHFLDANTVLVSKETALGFDHYSINTSTRVATKLNISVVTDNVIPSPDGKHIAYTDDNSNVYIYTLEGGVEKKISEDVSEKLEIQWASDNSALFYIDGPSSNAIAKMTLDGIITKVVDDKVNYKSELFVHANNTTFLYTVTKTAKVTSDTSGVTEGEELPDFDVVIDPTGTEPQLFLYDSTAETPAAKALTTDLNNKTYSSLLSDGTVVYLSTDTTDEEALPQIKTIDKNMKEKTIILADVDLLSLKVANDKLIAFGYLVSDDGDDRQFIYEIDAVKGKTKKLAELPLSIVNITLGTASNQVVATDVEGRLYNWNNKWNMISK